MNKWKNVEVDGTPAPGKTVIAYYKNSSTMSRQVFAFYASKFSIVAKECDEVTEYSESHDIFYIPEGWYECIENWDEFSSLAITENEVTHWMDKPKNPD